MFALQDEPEKGHRLKWLAAGAVLAAGLQGGGLVAASRYEPPTAKKQVVVEMTVFRPPPPPPKVEPPPPPPEEKPPEPPPEPPKPEPKPEPPKPKPKPKPEKKPPPPPPKEAPAPPPEEPPAPLVIGMQGATTAKGPGPVVQMGNNMMGEVGKTAKAPPKGPAPAGDKVVKSDGPPREPVKTKASLIKKVSTQYTKAALRAGVEGEVILVISVDEKGNVTQARVVKGVGFGLDERAQEAVMGWKYKPATVDGAPVATPNLRVKVKFELDD